MTDSLPLLECKNISKTFPGVHALDKIDFKLYPGEIHGLVGENGAGKSTLVKIFAGVITYDDIWSQHQESGMYLSGKKVVFRSPNDAIKQNIMMIHQELNVVPDLTVYENIFLNQEIKRFGIINRKKMIKATKKMIDLLDAEMDPCDLVKNLSVDKQKLVEVLKAINHEAKILIMDEPTSVLVESEAQYVIKVMKNIIKNGIGIIFISHNLNEVISICDRVTILRDGRFVASIDHSELDMDGMVTKMVGKKLVDFESEKIHNNSNEVLFEVKGLHYKNLVKNVSFDVKRGEIIGITGLVGSGGTELAKTIFGMEGFNYQKGTITLDGKKLNIKTPKDAIKNGIALLTEDRKNEGLFLKFNIVENICITNLKKFLNRWGLINKRKQAVTATDYIAKLNIKTPGIGVEAESLSGGNQQKVVFAKWLDIDPKVFIMDEPTIGVDVGAKNEIRKIILQLISQGKSIILITNEFVELKNLCNRALIMFKGEIVKELSSAEITEEKILYYSLGGERVKESDAGVKTA